MQFESEKVAYEVSVGSESSQERVFGLLFSGKSALRRLLPLTYSLADQVLTVAGGFLVNVVLARIETTEAFGRFVLCYSLWTFAYGLYNATLLEPYTVFASGRYRQFFSEYLRLIARVNLFIGFVLSFGLVSVYALCRVFAPQLASPALLGLGCTIGILLTAAFLRRSFYIQREPAVAAQASLTFIIAVSGELWAAARLHVLNSFSAFLILALGWMVAGLLFGNKLAFGKPKQGFLELQPLYWRQHWIYSRWVVASIFFYQLTTQGYYWLLAAFLSVKEVGQLRAAYLLVSPVEQGFIAISFLALPAMASRYAAGRMRDLFNLWKQNVVVVIGITGLFALTIRVFGKAALHMLYHGKFDGLAPLLYMLALSPVLIGTAGTMVNVLSAIENPKLVFCGYLCSGTMTFLLGIPLLKHFGLTGAVYGILLSGATLAVALGVTVFLKVGKQARRRHPANAS